MRYQELLILILVILPALSAAALLLPVAVWNDRKNIWAFSLISTVITFIISLMVTIKFDFSSQGMQLGADIPWVPGFGLHFSYGLDSISLWLVLLTTFLMPLVITASLKATSGREKEYYFWLLLIEAAMIGTFIATDIIFFYLCFEFTLIPLYFLIGIFGSTNRLKAAKWFFFYTFTGSMLTLAGVLYVAWYTSAKSGAWTFAIADLYRGAQEMSGGQQAWVLAALLAGFAVKVPLWPVHTWLPLAHTEAPTAGSVILAGVLLKLGTYGLLRFALPMCPIAVIDFAPWIATLAIIGILYAALVCWVQRDMKKLIAYSSVSHLGFCVLGLFALDDGDIGAIGSVMYMLNHGLSTGALFLCVGMIYERFHTKQFADFGGLVQVMPVWAFFTVFFVLSSVGLPGLNGFVGEILTLLGAFASTELLGWRFAAPAAAGMIFAAVYLLYMVGQAVFGPLRIPQAHGISANEKPQDLSGREVFVLAPLAAVCLIIGLFPGPMLQSLEEPVSILTEPARQHLVLARQPDAKSNQPARFEVPTLELRTGVGTRPGNVVLPQPATPIAPHRRGPRTDS